MSLIAMQGGATGTGTVTLLAPITNTDRTLTLPDATDTVAGIAATQTLTNKTLTSPSLTTPNIDSAQFATVTGTAPIYPCRAWVNFNGTGTVAIRASGNVSSITDNGTGDYTVNFTTAMPDANYCIQIASRNFTSNTNKSDNPNVVDPTTSAIRMYHLEGAGPANTDSPSIYVAVFR
jgi:hypothetical protein